MSSDVSTYVRPAWSNWTPIILAALSAIMALGTAAALPSVVTTVVEVDGRRVPIETHVNTWLIVFAALQLVAVCAASGGAVLSRLGRVRSAKRSLEVAVLAGLVPAVVPAVFALLARLSIEKIAR
jgi:hypothetical protein